MLSKVMCMFAVECKTVFKKGSFMADELVEVQVYLRSSAPMNLSMSRVVILFVKEVRACKYMYVLSSRQVG